MKNKYKNSKIKIINLNKTKQNKLNLFIDEYAKAVNFYIDYLWNNKISFMCKNQEYILHIDGDLLNCPKFILTSNIEYKSILSARALSCASTQACGIVKSHISKRKKYLYIFNKLKSENKRTRGITKKLNKTVIVKPNITNIEPNLNSICSKIEKSNLKHFDHILSLFCLGKPFGKIIIPFNYNKHSNKLESKGNLCSGIMISKTNVSLIFKIPINELKSEGISIGADQGINTCVTFSDSQTTQKNNHGQDLHSILTKLSNKIIGSKSFNKTLEQRNNYINWSINKLNLINIKEIKLEKISNFRYKKQTSKFLNYFGEKLIRQKLIDFAQDQGVLVTEQSSPFRSQRCSCCGYVSKKNRKGKLFSCKHCTFSMDADLNASLNHEQTLPFSFKLFASLRKIKEFFWKEDGFFNLDGSEIIVPDTKKEMKLSHDKWQNNFSTIFDIQ